MQSLFTLASRLPTEGSGIPIHKGGNWPELGEDASENSGDHVIYHPKPGKLREGKGDRLSLRWESTLGVSPVILLFTWPISMTARDDFHVHASEVSD